MVVDGSSVVGGLSVVGGSPSPFGGGSDGGVAATGGGAPMIPILHVNKEGKVWAILLHTPC